jgi:two-component SAPR family response regulator
MEQYIINQIRKGNLNTNAEIEIFKFEHAKDAINSLSLKPNIIFLDYLLGVNETGLDFYYKVKPLLPNTDIIFLSGVEDTAALRAVTDNGQNKFIAKDNNMFSKVFETLKEKVNNFHLM